MNNRFHTSKESFVKLSIMSKVFYNFLSSSDGIYIFENSHMRETTPINDSRANTMKSPLFDSCFGIFSSLFSMYITFCLFSLFFFYSFLSFCYFWCFFVGNFWYFFGILGSFSPFLHFLLRN